MAMAAAADAGNETDNGEISGRLNLRPFREVRTLWLDLTRALPGAALYHRDSWIELLSRSYGLSLWLATLHQGDRVTAGCVFARASLSRRFVALSFSDSCPPLAAEPDAARQLLTALAAGKVRRSYEIRGFGRVPGWETVECFVDWQLSLDRPLKRIESGLANNFRRNLRRAAHQAITIERGCGPDVLRRFYALQLESRRRLGLPPQPWRFFKCAQEIFGADGNMEVWIARENGEDAASAVFLRDGEVVYYKWGARRSISRSFANHLLFWNAIEEFAPRARMLDLGRADVRNSGLMRFKSELGAVSVALPCCFYPRAPAQVSAEVLTGTRATLAKIWSRLPVSATRMAGAMLYRFLS